MVTVYLTSAAMLLLPLPARFEVDFENMDETRIGYLCFFYKDNSWGLPTHMIAGISRPRKEME